VPSVGCYFVDAALTGLPRCTNLDSVVRLADVAALVEDELSGA
jgi:hypothetical protein